MLSSEQLSENGFLLIPNFFTAEKVQALKDRSHEIIRNNFDPQTHPLTKFDTDKQDHIGNEYFLESGDKIRFFLEKKAFKDGKLIASDVNKAINKIGHGLHLLDPLFNEFTINEKTKSIMKSLNFKSPIVLQSMTIFKQPYIGGEVNPHQDSTFLYTKPLSAVGFWIPLDDAELSNGALSFLPGTHKSHPITQRFIRNSENSCNGTRFIGNEPNFPDTGYIPIQATKGSLVLIHGSVIHKSEPNFSDHPRNVYTFHVIDGAAEYLKDNWLQIPSGFTAVY